MASENALYIILIEKIKQNALVLPTLPKIALKVREAADDPDINLNVMSDTISQDPALSIGMLKVANSAMMGRAVKVDTVNQAVTRIGLRRIKTIATAMAVEQIFVSDNEIVTMFLKKSWANTVDIASAAIALMTFYKHENKHSPLEVDNLALSALIHNIGVLPILTEAENHPEVFANPTFLKQAFTKLASPIGAEVIKAWDFSDEFVEVVRDWNDLTVLPKEPHYIDFIRAGAVKNGVFKSQSTCEVLLKSYVDKGILPSVEFLESSEYEELITNVKTMFS